MIHGTKAVANQRNKHIPPHIHMKPFEVNQNTISFRVFGTKIFVHHDQIICLVPKTSQCIPVALGLTDMILQELQCSDDTIADNGIRFTDQGDFSLFLDKIKRFF